jgi:hypothetical protein
LLARISLDCENHREDAQHLTTTLRQKGGRSLNLGSLVFAELIALAPIDDAQASIKKTVNANLRMRGRSANLGASPD